MPRSRYWIVIITFLGLALLLLPALADSLHRLRGSEVWRDKLQIMEARDVDAFDASIYADADLVIPYCLKDFRGFEGAKKLQAQGLDNVGLVEGFGINAWKRAELPIAGSQPARSDAEAIRQLVHLLEMEVERP